MRRDLQTAIRITEVLSYFKEDWYIDWVLRVGKREANRIKRAAMTIGSEVDEIIKGAILGKPFPIKVKSQEVKNCILAYQKWLNTYQPKTMDIGERMNANIEGHEVTGEPDIFVDDTLVDIKCAKKISLSYWVQVNMYKLLTHIKDRPSLEDSLAKDAINPGKVAILRLDKETASYEYVVKDYNPSLVSVWVGLLRAFVYYKGDSDERDKVREN